MDNAMQLKGGSIHAGRQRPAGGGSGVDHAPRAQARGPQVLQHGSGGAQSRRPPWQERQLAAPGKVRLS